VLAADVTCHLDQLYPRPHRVQRCLLQPYVVDRAPAVGQADARSRVVEGEVVVEAVRRVGERPLVEVEGGEQNGGRGARRRAEVAPPSGSVDHARRLPFGPMVSTGFESRVIELREGTKVHLRPITPEDEPLLHEAVSAMSERTVYFRFFSPIKRMSDALAHRLAVVDYNEDRKSVV